MGKRYRVVIADDQLAVREGLKSLLGMMAEIELVGEITAQTQIDPLTRQLQPDVLMLDIDWNRNSAYTIEVIRSLKRGTLPVRILAMTVFEELIGPAQEAGAELAVNKAVFHGFDQIRDYIVQVAEMPLRNTETIGPGERLSERELQVLRLVANGHTDREIASQLGFAEGTVGRDVTSICTKLGATNRTHAVAIASRLGLLN